MEVQRLNGTGRFCECKMRLLSCAEMWCESLSQCHEGSFTYGQFLKQPSSFVLQIFTLKEMKLMN